MSINPYKTPESDVVLKKDIVIPDAIAKKIKGGWIAAIVSGVITLAMVLLVVYSGSKSAGNVVDLWNSLDVVFIFILAYGMYKKSRIAASIMFIYFLASKILIIAETGQPNGVLLSLMFLYYFFQAMVGTFQYHKLVRP